MYPVHYSLVNVMLVCTISAWRYIQQLLQRQFSKCVTSSISFLLEAWSEMVRHSSHVSRSSKQWIQSRFSDLVIPELYLYQKWSSKVLPIPDWSAKAITWKFTWGTLELMSMTWWLTLGTSSLRSMRWVHINTDLHHLAGKTSLPHCTKSLITTVEQVSEYSWFFRPL